MDKKLQKELIDYLGQFVTSNKHQIIEEVLGNRTRYVTIALEDIFQPQNASAALRTSDLFGVQDVTIIENENQYKVNKDVVLGASKWLTLHQYETAPDTETFNTPRAMDDLRARGYKLVATSPNVDGFSPMNIPLDHRLAFFFGQEQPGLTDYVLEHADYTLYLPMYGFTQSFNISVSVAITLTHVIQRLRASKKPWALTAGEKDDLRLEWYRKLVRNAELVESDYIRNRR